MKIERFPDHPLTGKLVIIKPDYEKDWIKDDDYKDYIYFVKEVYAYKPRKTLHLLYHSRIPGKKGNTGLDFAVKEKRRINFPIDVVIPIAESGMNKAFSYVLKNLED